jgi:hypothetical protein
MAKRTSLLRVPIRVDALYVPKEQEFARSMADFSLLPCKLSNGSTLNADTPNLAEAAFVPTLGLAPDEHGTALPFPQGLHLHWALPDALATGYHRDGKTQFPAVPNRWLVRRLDDKGSCQREWIVESDFLHPCDKQTGEPTYLPPPLDAGVPIAGWPGGKPITFPTWRRDTTGAAFRYMGRTLLLQDWLQKKTEGAEYLNQDDKAPYQLTAIGYGEPAFAAYYPNCYSVFGLCDVDPRIKPVARYEYQVIGWYQEASLDPLQSEKFTKLASDADRYAALEAEYHWFVGTADKNQAFPAGTACYASLTLTPGKVVPWSSDTPIKIAIGNTGGEALAALLADELGGADQKAAIENQLEAMNLASVLQGVAVDYPAHFAQARHRRGFRGVQGGHHWAVLPATTKFASAAQATQAAVDTVPQPPLPDPVAHALDALNAAQEAYDMTQQEIVELRYQTFCDWHKFMVAYYSDDDDVGLRPFRHQSAALKSFIARGPLALLKDKIDLVGTLANLSTNPDGTLDLRTSMLTPPQPAKVTLAAQVILRLKALADTLTDGELTEFAIARRPAEPFWRPREPVVLLAGPVAIATPRHGEDGDLACAVLDLPDAPAPATAAFIDAVVKPLTDDPSILTQKDAPWHPIILEWSVSMQPVDVGRRPNPAIPDTLDYDPSFLANSFDLGENAPDVSPRATYSVRERANSYGGRCVMTAAAGTQLDGSLRAYLGTATLHDCRDPTATLYDPATKQASPYLGRLVDWYVKKPGHRITPPAADADTVAWARQQKTFSFADEIHKDAGGNALPLPVAVVRDWYAGKPLAEADKTIGQADAARQAQDPFYSAIRALALVEGRPVLSQALGGFNAALMTRRQVLQIPIEDPMAEADPGFISAVAQAVGRQHPLSPLADNVFCPIRAGRMMLEGLRLLDTFGQQWNAPVRDARLVTSAGLVDPKLGGGAIYLPPRFSLPVRLNFRWLAGLSGEDGADEVEMNSAPATTPICGWLLPNNFDNSLMVYDNTGKALGSIDILAEWMPAPGNRDRIAAAEIADPHLRRLVRRLTIDAATPGDVADVRRKFLKAFITTLDSAFEAIEPASFAQHAALALLIGRPVAVARATVDLQLMGQPTQAQTAADPTGHTKTIRLSKSRDRWNAFADQNWTVFAYDWGSFYGGGYDAIMDESAAFTAPPPAGYARTTHGFEKVVVPLRLGEHQLLDDGLVGFWKETAAGELDNVFHAPQTLESLKIDDDQVIFKDGCTNPCIRAYKPGVTDNLTLTLQDDPLALTLLVDPRGVVHASCGLLPVSKLEIPPAYHADVLKRMGVTFRVSPLITDTEQLHAALPKEAGYAWSWVAKRDGSTWEETATIAEATEHAHFFKPPKIVEGWFKLTPTDKE